MRRLIILLFSALVPPLIIAAIIFINRQAISDFVSDLERTAEAPLPRRFEDVAGSSPSAIILEEGEEDVEPAYARGELRRGEEGAESDFTEQATALEPLEPPSKFNLAVPFTSQAPLANWDAVHEDACEEAAVYMVHQFYEGAPSGKIDPDAAEAELLKIVEFEKVLFGFFESTTAAQIAVLAEQMYGYGRVEVVGDPTVDDLKAHIAAGRPVIVPSAGRMLGNPNFTGEGPLYHALVLKGYTETTFVTNDPGTRLGADYQYDFDTIMNAMHDWNGGEVADGAKVVVVIYPNP